MSSLISEAPSASVAEPVTVTHYACRECENSIERGESGWENWFCPKHPGAIVDSLATKPKGV